MLSPPTAGAGPTSPTRPGSSTPTVPLRMKIPEQGWNALLEVIRP